MIDVISRRGFLAASTCAAGATAFGASASPLQPGPLIAVDQRFDASELRDLMLRTRRPDFVLGHDVVRLWRDRLRHVLAGGTPIAAYTRWDLSLLLADMAREDGLKLQQTHLARSVMLTQIGGARRG